MNVLIIYKSQSHINHDLFEIQYNITISYKLYVNMTMIIFDIHTKSLMISKYPPPHPGWKLGHHNYVEEVDEG